MLFLLLYCLFVLILFLLLPVPCTHHLHLLHHHCLCFHPPLLVPILLYCCFEFLCCIVLVDLVVAVLVGCHWCGVIIALMLYCCIGFCVLFLFLFMLFLLLSLACTHHLLCHFPLFLLLSWCIVVLHCCCDIGAFVNHYFCGMVLFLCLSIIHPHHS